MNLSLTIKMTLKIEVTVIFVFTVLNLAMERGLEEKSIAEYVAECVANFG